jgi:hypothetical protein
MTHDAAIDRTVPPSGNGCAECLATGGWWFHLRRCTSCGHIGCCDSSPSQHATAHYHASGHPVVHKDILDIELTLAPPGSHPADQPAPGPAGRVPQDWVRHLRR